MASFKQANRVKTNIARAMMRKPEITGIGVGFANPRCPKQGAAIIIYTEKSAAAARLSLPTKVTSAGLTVPIRTIAAGMARPNKVRPTQTFTQRIRPVPGGYSVGFPSLSGSPGASGTAGLIVRKNGSSRLLICSNDHVLNRNNTAGFTETIQPGAADGGRPGLDRIGRLDRFVRLRKNGVNLLDAATSVPDRNKLLSPTYAVVGTVPGHLMTYPVGARFKKVGRTTGFVRGTVESVNTNVKVNYGSYGGLGMIEFANQTIVTGATPVSEPGDSGSVWLRNSDSFAAAVNFAGLSGGLRSVSYPFNWFAQVFGVRVATPRGAGGSKPSCSKPGIPFAKPLTPRQLAGIQVVSARRRRRA
ncbi:hypothetical protein [Paenibacillus sp. y28]|uniref:hypothetical protein n=1 Tax=Paenibacillus sp. y28 TaxID=3129110 RepID=UPI0030168A7F